jgi:hypothetical protein
LWDFVRSPRDEAAETRPREDRLGQHDAGEENPIRPPMIVTIGNRTFRKAVISKLRSARGCRPLLWELVRKNIELVNLRRPGKQIAGLDLFHQGGRASRPPSSSNVSKMAKEDGPS